ncbi:hypothetical protein F5051DRAFT_336607, partial [Lentinula edodes]
VFQYCLNGYILMMDCDDSYILWTTMWKVDVMQLLRLRPDLARSVRIVKNGKSQIRGTWLPYQVRFDMIISFPTWPFRNQLTPFFG